MFRWELLYLSTGRRVMRQGYHRHDGKKKTECVLFGRLLYIRENISASYFIPRQIVQVTGY